MRHLTTFLFFQLIANVAIGGGGIWVLQVDFDYNGVKINGYIRDENYDFSTPDLIGQDSTFNNFFHAKFDAYEHVNIYGQIIDLETIASYAKFPMPSFHIVDSSIKPYSPKKMKNASLKKVWIRNDYEINVLTGIDIGDTTWIAGTHTISYPIGEDPGCRLEVYNFGKNPVDHIILEKVVRIYKSENRESSVKRKEFAVLLNALKDKKIVVSELCGC